VLVDRFGEWTAVTNLHQLHKILPGVEGSRPLPRGLRRNRRPLRDRLEQGLGNDFTPPVKEAWTEHIAPCL
jgi:hypothetical protein